MLVNDFLQNNAERFPGKVALVCDGRRLTYAEIEEQANRVANGLLALGVRRGDRVAIWLPNSVEGRFPFLYHRVVEFCGRLPPISRFGACGRNTS